MSQKRKMGDERSMEKNENTTMILYICVYACVFVYNVHYDFWFLFEKITK
jgi:hypothetical protein